MTKRNFYTPAEIESAFVDGTQLEKLHHTIDSILITQYMPLLAMPMSSVLDFLKILEQLSKISDSDNFRYKTSSDIKPNLYLFPFSLRYVQSLYDLQLLLKDYLDNPEYKNVSDAVSDAQNLILVPVGEYLLNMYDYILNHEMDKIQFFNKEIQEQILNDQTVLSGTRESQNRFEQLVVKDAKDAGDNVMNTIFKAIIGMGNDSAKISESFLKSNKENLEVLAKQQELVRHHLEKLKQLSKDYSALWNLYTNN